MCSFEGPRGSRPVARSPLVRPRAARSRTFSGGYCAGETPLPIPNRAVKPRSADGTWLARAWESRSPPVLPTSRPLGGSSSLTALSCSAVELVDTERLRLERWTEAHSVPFAAINAQPVVVRFINGGVPLTREESDASSAAMAAHWETHGFGLWAVRERDGGAMVGFAGLV